MRLTWPQPERTGCSGRQLPPIILAASMVMNIWVCMNVWAPPKEHFQAQFFIARNQRKREAVCFCHPHKMQRAQQLFLTTSHWSFKFILWHWCDNIKLLVNQCGKMYSLCSKSRYRTNWLNLQLLFTLKDTKALIWFEFPNWKRHRRNCSYYITADVRNRLHLLKVSLIFCH